MPAAARVNPGLDQDRAVMKKHYSEASQSPVSEARAGSRCRQEDLRLQTGRKEGRDGGKKAGGRRKGVMEGREGREGRGAGEGGGGQWRLFAGTLRSSIPARMDHRSALSRVGATVL